MSVYGVVASTLIESIMRSRRPIGVNNAMPRGGYTDAGSMTSNGYYSGGGGGGGGGNGDTFTHVSYERASSSGPPGVGAKVGNSLAGLCMGPVFILLGCLLLWYNEEWAIKTHRSLDEAMTAHVEIPNAAVYEENNDGRLVHLTHMMTVDEPPVDDTFGLSRSTSVSVSRNVEIYQWTENHRKEKRKLQNGEVEVKDIYSYNKKWVKSPVNSNNFMHPNGHENEGSLPFTSQTFNAEGIKLGVYLLSNTLMNKYNDKSSVPVTEAKELPPGAIRVGDSVYFPQGGGNNGALPEGGASTEGNADLSQAIEKKIVTIDGEDKIMYTVKTTGQTFSTKQKALDAAAAAPVKSSGERRMTNVGSTNIGDVKVTFSEVKCSVVSVLAKLAGKVLTKWESKQGSGYSVAMLSRGNVSAESMIKSAQSTNHMFTWFKRACGWFLNFIGVAMITQVITTTASITLNWIPVLGPMSTSIISLGVSIANVVLATTISLPVAAISWVTFRPVLGISLLAGSLGLFYMASSAGSKGKRFE